MQPGPSDPSFKEDVESLFFEEVKAHTPSLNLSNAGFNFG